MGKMSGFDDGGRKSSRDECRVVAGQICPAAVMRTGRPAGAEQAGWNRVIYVPCITYCSAWDFLAAEITVKKRTDRIID